MVEFFVFRRGVAGPEQFPLDGYPQTDFHCKTPVNQRFDSMHFAKVVLFAGINQKRFHWLCIGHVVGFVQRVGFIIGRAIVAEQRHLRLFTLEQIIVYLLFD